MNGPDYRGCIYIGGCLIQGRKKQGGKEGSHPLNAEDLIYWVAVVSQLPPTPLLLRFHHTMYQWTVCETSTYAPAYLSIHVTKHLALMEL